MNANNILFKAKRKDNGEWVEGYYSYLFDDISNDYKHELVFQHMESADMSYPYPSYHTIWAEIDPSTLCQWTTLTDKNGKKVFSGDVIREQDGNEYRNLTIEWSEDYLQFIFSGDDTLSYQDIEPTCIKVIGNIHDKTEHIVGANDMIE